MSTSGGIIVKDIPPGLGAEVIKQYLFSKGGEIVEFRSYKDGKKALVKFEDTKVIAGLLSSSHKIGRHVITVTGLDEEKYTEANDGDRPDVDSSKPVRSYVDAITECDLSLESGYDHSPLCPVQITRKVEYELPQWKVLKIKLFEIESQAALLGVHLVHPTGQASVHVVEVVGNISSVLQIVQCLEDLKQLVNVSSKTVRTLPGLWAVLQSMEDRIRIMEHDYNVAISITAGCGDDVGMEMNEVAFTAVVNQCLIEVCFGNFTCHPSATSIVNILVHNINKQYLNLLVKGGGKRVCEDVMGRIKELSTCELPQVFETKPHNLKVKKLVHCVVPKWNGGQQKEVHVLKAGLCHAIVSSAPPCIVISPLTLPPLQYPAIVMAKALIEVIESISLDTSFALYVDTVEDAKAIEMLFKDKRIQVQFKDAYQKIKPSNIHDLSISIYIRDIKSKLPSFISVIKGDIFQQKVQGYVNSTNSDLDLSRGMLSQQLFKRMGQRLQDECNEYAPLSTGQVAVTSAENMYCDVILHVALPVYKSKGSERALMETMRNILRICLSRNMTSIAIPSLGVGKLHYPHHVVANVLFTEVLAFNEQHPAFFQNIVFVLSEKEIYESFMKVYVEQICICGTEEVDSLEVEDNTDPGMSTQLILRHGSIEDECVDVIVNPTTADIDLSSNQVSQAISKKAGEGLLAFCSQLRDSGVVISEKNSMFTKASGQLRCKKVLHVYTPTKCPLQSGNVDSVIFSIVLDALHQAEKGKYRSLSLPLIGYGYPVETRAKAVIEASLEFGQSAPVSLKEIVLVVSDKCHFENVHSCFSTFKARHNSQCHTSEVEGKDYVLKLQLRSCMISKHVYRCLHPWNVTDLKVLEKSNALIKVFGFIPEQTDLVIQEIESKVMKELITECIHDDQIHQLIASEIADLCHTISMLGVSVVLKKEDKKIVLSGERNRVRDAQTLVLRVLSTLRYANIAVNKVIWQRETENGFHTFPNEISCRLETALIKEGRWLEVCVGGIRTVIDLEGMLETDLRSGKTCSIRRLEKLSHIEFPPCWQPQPMDQGQEKTCHMFNVDSNTEEYKCAMKEFKETMYGLEFSIINLERIQNFNEYTKHCAFLDVLKRRHGGKVLLKRLFHGTSADSIPAIAHQGFNRIFAADANAAVFGKGVYFASRANYSAQEKYAVPDEYGNQRMFICRVVVGKYTKGEKTMKVAPPLDANKNKHLLFDTLVNDPINPTIYVVMSDSQAYPEYLVTFRKKL